MSQSVIYEVTHDSLRLISKQDYGSPCAMSMQVNMPRIVQLHSERSKTSEPCKGWLSRLFFYDGLEALKAIEDSWRSCLLDFQVDPGSSSVTHGIAPPQLSGRCFMVLVTTPRDG